MALMFFRTKPLDSGTLNVKWECTT